jgi:hypothetical protein
MNMRKITLIFLLASSSVFAQTNKGTPATGTQPAATATVSSASGTAPIIEFESTVHEFGTLKKGSPITHNFKYTNTGKEPLILYHCKAGCGCTSTKCTKDPIRPGATGFIEVHYDSMRVGTFGKEVMVASNAKNGIVNLIIKGTVIGEMEGTDAVPVKNNEEPMKKPDVKHNE